MEPIKHASLCSAYLSLAKPFDLVLLLRGDLSKLLTILIYLCLNFSAPSRLNKATIPRHETGGTSKGCCANRYWYPDSEPRRTSHSSDPSRHLDDTAMAGLVMRGSDDVDLNVSRQIDQAATTV